MNNVANINSDHEELVDCIFYSGRVFISSEFANELYQSDSQKVKDLLMEIDYNIKQGLKRDSIDQLIDQLAEVMEEN